MPIVLIRVGVRAISADSSKRTTAIIIDGEEDEDLDGQGIFPLTEIEGSFANALQGGESFVLKEANKELLAPAEA